jgi:ABC-2 type transport system ATP-binding protein
MQFGFIDHGVLLKEITHNNLHEHTKKTLMIDVDDVTKAQAALQSIGITGAAADGNRLRLEAHLDRSNEIARALINGGLEVYDLHRQETTLEEYFVRLVGGEQSA